jgi:hypothetical protein
MGYINLCKSNGCERDYCRKDKSSDRARYRDFYDLTLLLEKYPFYMECVFELIKQKEIRKPISQESIMQNWNITLLERNTEASRIYYAHELEDSKILQLIEKLQI